MHTLQRSSAYHQPCRVRFLRDGYVQRGCTAGQNLKRQSCTCRCTTTVLRCGPTTGSRIRVVPASRDSSWSVKAGMNVSTTRSKPLATRCLACAVFRTVPGFCQNVDEKTTELQSLSKGITVTTSAAGSTSRLQRLEANHPPIACLAERVHMRTVWLLLLLVVMPRCQGLSTAGVSDRLWHHVLNVEPNRHLQQLGEISETNGLLTRTYFSSAHKKAAQQVLQWMQNAGMTAHIDAIGNVHGIIEGTKPELGELLVGSHYDTVVDGGKYDGALGLLLAISAVKAVLIEALHRTGKLDQLGFATQDLDDSLDIDLPAAAVKGLLPGSIHVVGFCDEEGIRFKSTFLGSRAVAGTLLKHNQLTVRDADGLTFEEVLKASGVENPAEAVKALALDPARIRHYIEFHIEQGPQLEAAGLALGVVSGIAGQTWLTVSVEGVQNHGGTVPMPLRKDPMSAAAEAINAIEGTCLGKQDELGGVNVEGEALVCTVGRVLVHPNQVNIIPRWVNFTVDVRCQRQEFREDVIALAEARVQAVCNRRGVNCTITKTHDARPVHSDSCLIKKLQSAVLNAQPVIQQLSNNTANDQQQLGTCSSSSSSADEQPGSCAAGPSTATQSEVPVLMSGAGHDAMAIADVTKVAMVFVRCEGGVSHNPAEHVDSADVAAATAAFATFMEMDVLDWEQHMDDECSAAS